VAKLVADYVLQRLTKWGVHRIYGYPGDGINAFLGAFDRADGDPEFVQVRHEEMAAFMACGHAKFTGEAGVCIATSGPGAIHLLNGLYDAKLDHQPVVAIVGQQARTSLGGNYQQEVDLETLFNDVAHEYVHMATHPAQMRHLVDRSMRIALDQRTVTCIIVPNDLASEKAVETPPHEHGTVHSGIGYSRPRIVPMDADLERAAAVLNESRKVAMLVGQGAKGAADEVLETAETLSAGVAKALLGKERASGRSAVRHRLDRAARNEAELGLDDGLRRVPDGRLVLPVLRVPAGGGRGTRRADRRRRPHGRDPLPDGREPRR
jgi:pyruvate dehydrogenase (quinone)